MRRQLPFDFIKFGDFLAAHLAYVFVPDLYDFNNDLTTSVAAPICPDFDLEVRSISIFFLSPLKFEYVDSFMFRFYSFK